jgi:hypothetical protein
MVTYKRGSLLTSADATSRIPRDSTGPEADVAETPEPNDVACSVTVTTSSSARTMMDFEYSNEPPVSAISDPIPRLPILDDAQRALPLCPDFGKQLCSNMKHTK